MASLVAELVPAAVLAQGVSIKLNHSLMGELQLAAASAEPPKVVVKDGQFFFKVGGTLHPTLLVLDPLHTDLYTHTGNHYTHTASLRLRMTVLVPQLRLKPAPTPTALPRVGAHLPAVVARLRALLPAVAGSATDRAKTPAAERAKTPVAVTPRAPPTPVAADTAVVLPTKTQESRFVHTLALGPVSKPELAVLTKLPAKMVDRLVAVHGVPYTSKDPESYPRTPLSSAASALLYTLQPALYRQLRPALYRFYLPAERLLVAALMSRMELRRSSKESRVAPSELRGVLSGPARKRQKTVSVEAALASSSDEDTREPRSRTTLNGLLALLALLAMRKLPATLPLLAGEDSEPDVQSRLLLHQQYTQLALRFRTRYAEYAALHRRLQDRRAPAPNLEAEVRKLVAWHKELALWKQQLWEYAGRANKTAGVRKRVAA